MTSYAASFAELTDLPGPHPYQETVAADILTNRHMVVRAPTGAGKTLAVIIPFLLFREQLGVAALIYVLPLRTLVESVAAEAQSIAEKRGFKVAVQTGERSDAEFFHDADIIVTTFDQLLSGLLCDPYGLSKKLWNINAAAIAGKMVVFDEFHLMEPDRAFVSALFGVRLFKDLCISVWMTATSSLVNFVCKTLNAKEVGLSPAELLRLFEGRGIQRAVETRWGEALTAEQVFRHKGKKVLVVVNAVSRAQSLYEELHLRWPALLLHSRFFSVDRRAKQAELKNWDLVISTQVIEAGVDISCEVLLTEAAPVNSLVQRAGRCARFAGETGTVLVFDAPLPLPYTRDQISTAKKIIENTASANPETCNRWVERAHSEEDRKALTGFRDETLRRRKLIESKVTGEGDLGGASSYIRSDDGSVRMFILADPKGVQPGEREAIQVRRTALRQSRSHAWVFDGEEWIHNGDLGLAYAIALPPSVARYTRELGLQLGHAGALESPPKEKRRRPGWGPIAAEPWPVHTANVVRCAFDRMRAEGLHDEFKALVEWTAKLHDVGKLQRCWQVWALDRQAQRGKPSDQPLAHTDYDWKLHKGEPRPPRHASASAIYSYGSLQNMTESQRAAILLAVLAHHGGTLNGIEEADKLHSNAKSALFDCGLTPTPAMNHVHFKVELLGHFMDAFDDVWPLAAILSRVLRLSDQQATSESGNG